MHAPSLHLLLVDDSSHLRAAMAYALTAAGHRVTVANGGSHALELFKPGQYDVVLTDFAMPAPNGIELAEAMKEADPNQRIALLSGYAEALPTGEKPECVDLLLRKPISLDQLTTALTLLGSTGLPAAGEAANA